MINPYLSLEEVSCVLPDGRTLFSNLNETFDQRRTGLVGRNGVGKSVLASILAGQVQPNSGHCVRSGSVYYLAQQVTSPPDATVATLAGMKHTLEALTRIEAGSSDPEDFDAVSDRWDIRQQLQAHLEQHDLGHLTVDTLASKLSGGEAMRVSLIGAWLSNADFLILDEPSNHLDRSHKHVLIDLLLHWPRGLLVVSHDRQLLDTMERIMELSSLGLHSYGGNYTFYAEAKALEIQNALQHLEQRKLERQREVQSMREQRERQARRQARGDRHGKEANQAKILLDRQKERSEGSSGKLRQQQLAARQLLDQQVREAAQQVQSNALITLHALPDLRITQRYVVELEAVELPFVQNATRQIHLTLNGQQRVGIIGDNGCGKSTLLKVLAGQLAPMSGNCNVTTQPVYLDQQLANLNPDRNVLEHMQAVNRMASQSDLRMRLAQLDLDAQKIMCPSGSLSGGERLKAALACVLYADPPPQLLLLDEPSNHLDLASIQALEVMLRSYKGAMIVVSHDDVFMNNLALTHRLLATEHGWRLETW